MNKKTINTMRGLLMALAFVILINGRGSYDIISGASMIILAGTSFALSYLKPTSQNHNHLRDNTKI